MARGAAARVAFYAMEHRAGTLVEAPTRKRRAPAPHATVPTVAR